MPESPADETHPPVRQSRTAEAIDAGAGFLTRVGKMTASQALTSMVVVLVLFLCWFVGNSDHNRAALESERVALLLRSQEAEAERNRAANAAEFSANRAMFAAEAERNRVAVAEMNRVMMATLHDVSVQIGRLEESVSGLRRKLPPTEPEPSVEAPMPRVKGGTPGG